MKRIVWLLSLGLIGGCAVTETALVQRYESVTPTRFEGAVAVVLEDKSTGTIDDKGEGMLVEGFRRVKIMDRKAMDCEGDAPNCRLQRYVCYDETWDKVELLEARTITPTGEVLAVEPDDIQDRTFTTWAVPDQGQRCMVWMAKGVVPGSILEERWKIRSSKIIGVGGLMLGDRDPVLEISYTIDTPADYPYRFLTKNIDIQPTEVKKGNRLVRTWTAKEVPGVQVEEGMVAPDDVLPKLLVANQDVSAFGEFPTCRKIVTWEDMGRCWNEMISKQQEATPIIKEVAEEIAKTAKTETEKVKAVWKYLNDNVRYVGLERGLAGFVPLSAHVVCSKKYGDCKAVAGLISVLCREMGMRADPILIGTRPQLGQLDTELPGPFYFNHSIARVEADGKVYWLDATGRDHSFDTTQARNQGVHVVVADPTKPYLDLIPVQPPEQNLTAKKIVFESAGDSEMKLNVEFSTKGDGAASYRGASHAYTPEKFNQLLADRVHDAYPQAVDIKPTYSGKENNEQPFGVDLTARIPRALQPAGKGLSFEVKDLFWSKDLIDWFSLPKRRYPLDLYRLDQYQTRFEIQIPAGMQPAGTPRNVMFDDDYFKVERLSQIEGDRVVAVLSVANKQLIIPPDKYPEARKSFQKALDAASFVLLFEPQKKKPS
jgi:hypothetical protein